MKPFVAAGLIAVLVLSGCGTRLNPMNWFGGNKEQRLDAAPEEFTADPRALVAEVTRLSIERMPGGAIVRATGLPPTQGFWDAELVADDGLPPENGEITFSFRVAEPLYARPASTRQSREIEVATFLSDNELSGVRRITVIGQSNRRSSNR